MQTIRFGICGGDLRQKYLAESLFAEGFPTAVWSGGGLPVRPEIPSYPWEALASWCDVFLLPVPVTKDGETVFAPYAEAPLSLKGDLPRVLRGKTVMGGMLRRLAEIDPLWRETDRRDYALTEGFAVRNAFLTAEGALALAVRHSDRAINGSACLITGFGRVGRALASGLLALGADVAVAARSLKDLAWAECSGCRTVPLSSLNGTVRQGEETAFLFNTIPAPVLTSAFLKALPEGCLLMELASPPYGFDHENAKALGKEVLPASGLPGRFSPRTAGEICKKAILSLLEE